MSDGSEYERMGVIDANSGQIDKSTGSINLRAKFENPDTLLRSGSTGKIIMEQIYPNAILIPQGATSSIQDKRFVFQFLEKGQYRCSAGSQNRRANRKTIHC